MFETIAHSGLGMFVTTVHASLGQYTHVALCIGVAVGFRHTEGLCVCCGAQRFVQSINLNVQLTQ